VAVVAQDRRAIVDDLNGARGGLAHADVLRLEVAVGDSLPVHAAHRGEQLVRDRAQRLRSKVSPAHKHD